MVGGCGEGKASVSLKATITNYQLELFEYKITHYS